MRPNSKIYVAGHRGLIGSAICNELKRQDFYNILTIERDVLDLRQQREVELFMSSRKPDYVFMCAGRVGGIAAHASHPARLLRDNLTVDCNMIHACIEAKVSKILYFGCNCVYPSDAPRPTHESALLTGSPEPINRAFAIAKTAGLALADAYWREHGLSSISLIPCSVYGPRDNFNRGSAHVIPTLIDKFHQAKVNNLPEVSLWGTGTAQREFLYSEDLARVAVELMKLTDFDSPVYNVGSGQEISIKDLAYCVADIVGVPGIGISFDGSALDGAPRKLLDCSKLLVQRPGLLHPTVELAEGISRTYNWYQKALKRS